MVSLTLKKAMEASEYDDNLSTNILVEYLHLCSTFHDAYNKCQD